MKQETMETMAEAIAEVERATAAYREADERVSAARCAAGDALNQMNKAQGTLDAMLDALRRNAPLNSDWANKGARRLSFSLPGIDGLRPPSVEVST